MFTAQILINALTGEVNTGAEFIQSHNAMKTAVIWFARSDSLGAEWSRIPLRKIRTARRVPLVANPPGPRSGREHHPKTGHRFRRPFSQPPETSSFWGRL